MHLLGKIGDKSDDMYEYIERVDQYFLANDVNDAKKKIAKTLKVIGSDS